MKCAATLIALFLLACGQAHAQDDPPPPDPSLILQLPDQREAALRASKTKWDSGDLLVMNEGTHDYSDKLADMMKALVRRYYRSDRFKAKNVDEMVKQVYALERSRFDARNPSGEWQGRESSLDVPYDAMEKLEALLVEMVKAISLQQMTFNFDQWNKQWEAAHAKVFPQK